VVVRRDLDAIFGFRRAAVLASLSKVRVQ
jgi:hypothetical protein